MASAILLSGQVSRRRHLGTGQPVAGMLLTVVSELAHSLQVSPNPVS